MLGKTLISAIFSLAVARAVLVPGAAPNGYFQIQVSDDQTGRGVPLVELRTVSNERYVTDSNGLVAFDEPGLMGQRVFFFIQSHGYEYQTTDPHGYVGTALNVQAGARAEIKIHRRNLAERLYRVTGEGIYRDSVLLGQKVPIRQPLLNAQVVGQDTVMAIPWHDKIYWFWGDTNWPRHVLGLFHTAGATSQAPGHGGLAPSVGVDLHYFVGRDGFTRAMAPMKEHYVVWLGGLVLVPDEAGRQRLAAGYTRVEHMKTMREHGVVVFDEAQNEFKKLKEFELPRTWRCPDGHPILQKEGSVSYYLFPHPFAVVRVKADLACVADPACYEAFTCLTPGSRFSTDAKVERGADGGLIYEWKRNTDPITVEEERTLVNTGKIKPDEARYQPRDVDSKKVVTMDCGSIAYNEFRKKWIMVATQRSGDSYLGEVWFSEADSPTGPWRWAKKIVTHDNYSFYQPVHHAFFDEDGGRLIYFEGTYSKWFTNNSNPTPRYEYNQIMYRLDLADPRLSAPREPSKR